MKIIIDGVKETNWRELFDAGEIELCNLVDKLVYQMAEEKLDRITYGCITIER